MLDYFNSRKFIFLKHVLQCGFFIGIEIFAATYLINLFYKKVKSLLGTLFKFTVGLQ